MKTAMAMVAHPDDCVIFAYNFIHAHPQFAWSICYLTYRPENPRAQEISAFWNQRGINTQFLGFRDEWESVKQGHLGFEREAAKQAIADAIKDTDLVLTHGFQGEYGHPHHKFVCETVANCHPKFCMVTFANPGQGNTRYILPENLYSLDELPMHREVIEPFVAQEHANEYCVSERVKKIL